ncbi:MAG: alpha-1,3-mannosyltransferase family protein [Verrucomicrobia bacterium]|nr:alpha-1,3-mannosyltransferase family protein [Verrucomicrobiota bacterium]
MWVALRALRRLGCPLQVECWCLNEHELDPTFLNLAALFDVSYRVASQESVNEVRPTHGWELKAYALVHSAFDQVILLDADNVPVRHPEFLFETPQFKETGALSGPIVGGLLKPTRSGISAVLSTATSPSGRAVRSWWTGPVAWMLSTWPSNTTAIGR